MDLTKSYPRAGELILGGYPWLARMIDKARAYNDATLGDYIFPCPIDQELLAELDLTGEEFAEIVNRCKTDEKILDELGLTTDEMASSKTHWTEDFIENRSSSLAHQAEEEGRIYHPPT